MDIRPPRKRPARPAMTPVDNPLPKIPVDESRPSAPLPMPSKGWGRRQWITLGLLGSGILLLASTISVGVWYRWAVQPPSESTNQVRVVIQPGETAATIAENLYTHDLIRSRLAFTTYVQLSGSRTKLQAGGYVLAPNQSVSEIVEHITTGKTDEFNITIAPGLTEEELKDRFRNDGYSEEEITEAFQKQYNHPLLASRPPGTSLEGYIFPETYRMNASQTLDELLERSFDELYRNLQENGYLATFASKQLTLHEAITLASIIQKEVSDPADQPQVAQVFLKRLAGGISLQSDPTFIYGARQMGVQPSTSVDSPYNTYKIKGLPPGPIGNFNFSALEAVVKPAAGDFLYFVADREGVTHFSKTLEEHERKVQRYCTDHCTDF